MPTNVFLEEDCGIIPWTGEPKKNFRFQYEGKPPEETH
jgi:hypothetical protein